LALFLPAAPCAQVDEAAPDGHLCGTLKARAFKPPMSVNGSRPFSTTNVVPLHVCFISPPDSPFVLWKIRCDVARSLFLKKKPDYQPAICCLVCQVCLLAVWFGGDFVWIVRETAALAPHHLVNVLSSPETIPGAFLLVNIFPVTLLKMKDDPISA